MREDVSGHSCGGWGKLVRISAFTWGKLVRISPSQVGQARENAWGMLVGNDTWPVGYTTVLTLLQRMTAKGLVSRRLDGRRHRYTAAVAEESLERRLAQEFLDRTFGGSVERLVRRVLPFRSASSDELERVRRVLDEIEDGESCNRPG